MYVAPRNARTPRPCVTGAAIATWSSIYELGLLLLETLSARPWQECHKATAPHRIIEERWRVRLETAVSAVATSKVKCETNHRIES